MESIDDLRAMDGDGYYDDWENFWSQLAPGTILYVHLKDEDQFYKLLVEEVKTTVPGAPYYEGTQYGLDKLFIRCKCLSTTELALKAHKEWPICYVGEITCYHLWKKEEMKLFPPGTADGEPAGQQHSKSILIP